MRISIKMQMVRVSKLMRKSEWVSKCVCSQHLTGLVSDKQVTANFQINAVAPEFILTYSFAPPNKKKFVGFSGMRRFSAQNCVCLKIVLAFIDSFNLNDHILETVDDIGKIPSASSAEHTPIIPIV